MGQVLLPLVGGGPYSGKCLGHYMPSWMTYGGLTILLYELFGWVWATCCTYLFKWEVLMIAPPLCEVKVVLFGT